MLFFARINLTSPLNTFEFSDLSIPLPYGMKSCYTIITKICNVSFIMKNK